jgi:hypothetical protein
MKEGLIFEIWVRGSDHAGNTVDFVSAAKYSALGVIKHGIFMKDLVDRYPAAHRIIFAKHAAQITEQQGRNAVGHGFSPLGHRAACDLSTRNASLAPAASQTSASGC